MKTDLNRQINADEVVADVIALREGAAMPEQPELDGMPAKPINLNVSGTVGLGPNYRNVKVGDEITFTVTVTVRKTGLSHVSGASPDEASPFANGQITDYQPLP